MAGTGGREASESGAASPERHDARGKLLLEMLGSSSTSPTGSEIARGTQTPPATLTEGAWPSISDETPEWAPSFAKLSATGSRRFGLPAEYTDLLSFWPETTVAEQAWWLLPIPASTTECGGSSLGSRAAPPVPAPWACGWQDSGSMLDVEHAGAYCPGETFAKASMLAEGDPTGSLPSLSATDVTGLSSPLLDFSCGTLPWPASEASMDLRPPLPSDEVSTSRCETVRPPSPGVAPTIGSRGHHLKQCKPCAFVHTTGCKDGNGCKFCHLCEPGEKKRRKKEKTSLWRASRWRD